MSSATSALLSLGSNRFSSPFSQFDLVGSPFSRFNSVQLSYFRVRLSSSLLSLGSTQFSSPIFRFDSVQLSFLSVGLGSALHFLGSIRFSSPIFWLDSVQLSFLSVRVGSALLSFGLALFSSHFSSKTLVYGTPSSDFAPYSHPHPQPKNIKMVDIAAHLKCRLILWWWQCSVAEV